MPLSLVGMTRLLALIGNIRIEGPLLSSYHQIHPSYVGIPTMLNTGFVEKRQELIRYEYRRVFI